jgi:hypothetical protein
MSKPRWSWGTDGVCGCLDALWLGGDLIALVHVGLLERSISQNFQKVRGARGFLNIGKCVIFEQLL